jgi:hypothetical protein
VSLLLIILSLQKDIYKKGKTLVRKYVSFVCVKFSAQIKARSINQPIAFTLLLIIYSKMRDQIHGLKNFNNNNNAH